MPDLRSGTVFAGHRIEGVCGRGGMGVVYRATHLALDHVVALKVISPELAGDVRFRTRFESESRNAVSIQHPNVVSVHHAGEEEGLLFVTMDYIEGTDLRGLLDETRELTPAQALEVLDPIASALDAAHARGLVHRDIKPGNILIERRNGDQHVYLTDFGLTKRIEAESGVTATGAFVGTLDYVAPEQIKGDRVDARADVYALGCVLFETLSGQAPFADRADKVAKMYAHLQDEPPELRRLVEGASPELEAVVTRSLAKDPEQRFPSAGDLARATRAATEGQPTVEAERSVATGAAAPVALATEPSTAGAAPATAVTEPSTAEASQAAPPAGPPARPEPARRRSPWPVLAGLTVLAAIAAVVVIVVSGGDGGGGEEDFGTASVVGDPISVPELPVGIAADGEDVWVGSRSAGELSRITDPEGDPSTIPVGGNPEGVAVGFESVWVADGSDNVLRVDPAGGDAESIHVGLGSGGVAIGEDRVWVAASEANVLAGVSPDGGDTVKIPVGGEFPYGVAVDGDTVWVTNRESNNVSRIDLTTLEEADGPDSAETQTVDVGSDPKGLVVAEGAVWVANTGDGTVSRIDPATNAEEDTITVGQEPRDIDFGFGSLWVTNGGDGTVSRIDPATLDVLQELRMNGSPEDLSIGADLVWVANGGSSSVSRIEP
jgi:YVTN family beta-propeller protein